MSLVYITSHNENIYDLEKEKAEKVSKPKRYTSKYNQIRKVVSKEEAEDKCLTDILISPECPKTIGKNRTMGYAETPLSHPSDFLRKSEGIKWKHTTDHKCITRKLPPIPKPSPIKKNPIRDFKELNRQKISVAIPKRPEPKFVDTRNGDKHRLESSGLMMAYVYRPDYGRVPNYINRFKEEFKRVFEEQEALQTKQKVKGLRVMQAEERLRIINGLKANWQELQKIYQGQSVSIATEPQKKRMTEMEKALRQVEKDILMLENNPLIYISENPDEDMERGERYRKRSK